MLCGYDNFGGFKFYGGLVRQYTSWHCGLESQFIYILIIYF